MNNILLCNCCGDDTYGKISNYLLQNHLEQVIQGIQLKAEEIKAEEVAVLLPVGTKYSVTPEIKIYYSQETPVAKNPYAAIEGMKGKGVRPFLSQELPVYEGKQVQLITPQEAYDLVFGKQTKFISLNDGKQSNIVEISLGSKLSEVMDENKIPLDKVKAILLGGITGAFIDSKKLSDYEVTKDTFYDSISVYYEESCMVEEIKQLAQMIQATSCGKCVLCREGSLQYMTIIEEMTTGKAKMADIDLLKEIGELIAIGAYCPFGQKFPRLFKTGLELFGSEFEAHIKKKTCPTGVCSAFGSYCILPKQCIGCEECLEVCPEDAIEGKKGFIHMIDEDLCEKCGKCVEACEEGAIIKVTGTKPKLPTKLTKVGKF